MSIKICDSIRIEDINGKAAYNNWIEYNGLIREESCQSGQKLINLGIICDNLLNDNILIAIDEVLDSYENIVSEICFVAKEDYGISGGEAI